MRLAAQVQDGLDVASIGRAQQTGQVTPCKEYVLAPVSNKHGIQCRHGHEAADGWGRWHATEKCAHLIVSVIRACTTVNTEWCLP